MSGQSFLELARREETGAGWDCHEAIRALPSLPASLFRFLGLVGDHDVSLGDLASYIWTDPALLSRALPLAAMAGQPAPGGLCEAIATLGRPRLRRLAFTTPLLRCTDPSGAGPYATALWERSQACAVACEAVARQLESSDPERCYLAGMLHDIGYLALFQTRPERLPAIQERYRNHPAKLLQIERELLGADHCELGFRAAESFGLPGWLGSAIGGYRRATPDCDLLTRITAIGSSFCDALGLQFLVAQRPAKAARYQRLRETICTLLPDFSADAALHLMKRMEDSVRPVCRAVLESIIEWQVESERHVIPHLLQRAQMDRRLLSPSAVAALA